MRQVELAPTPAGSPGEGPLFVAEELAFDEVFGDGGAVHLHQGLVSAAAQGMQGPGHQLLTGAIFANDEHRGVGGGHQGQFLSKTADGGAFTDDLLDRGPLLPQAPVLFGEPGPLQGVAHR